MIDPMGDTYKGLLFVGADMPEPTPPPFSFFAPKRWHWLEWLFWRKLCPQPDKAILGSIRLTYWLYNFTARIASRYHKKSCVRCQGR